MKIGIDAKSFFDTNNPSGKTIVTNLIRELLRLDNKNSYFIFLDKKYRDLIFPYKSNQIKLIYVWRGINLFSNIFVLPLVAWKYKLDIFLFQYFTPPICNFKKVVYIHDCIFKSHPEYFSFFEKIYYLPIKPLSKFADVIITVSNSEKERLIKYGFSRYPNRIKVVYNGYRDIFRKQAKDKYLIQKTKRKFNLPDNYLLYVGRLNHRKNILNLLRSINYLKNKEIKLVLVGQYNRKMFDLPLAIRDLGLTGRVMQLGYVEDFYLPIIYSLSTAFCYVSFMEGFGLPPLEAMASGVPVIISKSGSLMEVCGEAGTYCNPFDPIDIAQKIDTVISDDNLYQNKKQLGLRIASKFSWARAAEELLNIFLDV